jgi:hypothetical protein
LIVSTFPLIQIPLVIGSACAEYHDTPSGPDPSFPGVAQGQGIAASQLFSASAFFFRSRSVVKMLLYRVRHAGPHVLAVEFLEVRKTHPQMMHFAGMLFSRDLNNFRSLALRHLTEQYFCVVPVTSYSLPQ